MTSFSYDKTFEGLLCCVFFAFETKETPDMLLDLNEIKPLFLEKTYTVVTEADKLR